jgi:hypothetical protein
VETTETCTAIDCVEFRKLPPRSTIETKVERYGGRYWAVYLNGELLAVTVYKKGALAVQSAVVGQ